LLVKKDRGRPIDPTARPKAFGETTIASDVPGAELLDEDISSEGEGSDDDSDAFDSDDEEMLPSANDTQQSLKVSSNKLYADEDHKGEEEVSGEQDDAEEVDDDDSDDNMDDIEDDSDMDGDTDVSDEDDDEELKDDSENEGSDQVEDSDEEDKSKGSSPKVQKRKLSDYIGNLDAADASLRALKKFAVAKKAETSTDEAGRIFSDEDFKLIRERKAKKDARLALVQHGLSKGDTRSATFKLPSSDQLSMKRLDPSQLQAHIKRKTTKEERLEMVKAGREDRGKYHSKAAISKKKTGGSSNKQKQHKKQMPLAAKRAKVARSRREKKTKSKHSAKQFRGRKAWK